MQIANYQLANNLILAPMAGITDLPFRRQCHKFGAGLTVSEMVSANPKVWSTDKSLQRLRHSQDCGINSVQIAGSDPGEMAYAAQINVANGAQIIDINMGCPAKKVNKKLAGSALLKDRILVEQILQAVVNAVDVPVTLKIRTGWCPDSRNGVEIAKLAQDCGVQALAIHGRTRACLFKGSAEYDTIRAIKQAIDIPVIANGDITSAEQAHFVLNYTGADAIMIGRGAQGRPWIFRDIAHYLATGEHPASPTMNEVRNTMMEHIADLHDFYGEFKGVRFARKHANWYLASLDPERQLRREFNALESSDEQIDVLNQYFDKIAI